MSSDSGFKPKSQSKTAGIVRPNHESLNLGNINNHEDTFLLLHSTISRSFYGIRSPIIFERLLDWNPDAIVTLFDDVYVCWNNTQVRAKGNHYIGMPTLEQLILNRRVEMVIGDLLSANLGIRGNNVPHYFLATRHPCSLLDRLLYPPNELKTIYLSFPISAPRRMLKNGNNDGINEVNIFLKAAYDRANSDRSLALFCPLSIDELPLVSLPGANEGDEKCVFEKDMRWDMFSLCEHPLLNNDPLPDTIDISKQEIEEASSSIKLDVAIRDYRLIDQSQALWVFNPVFKEDDKAAILEPSGGVSNEIDYATHQSVPVYIYQNPDHDPGGIAPEKWRNSPSALGVGFSASQINFVNNMNDLFDSF